MSETDNTIMTRDGSKVPTPIHGTVDAFVEFSASLLLVLERVLILSGPDQRRLKMDHNRIMSTQRTGDAKSILHHRLVQEGVDRQRRDLRRTESTAGSVGSST
jgi:hypothetical protein